MISKNWIIAIAIGVAFLYCNALTTACAYFYFRYKQVVKELQMAESSVMLLREGVNALDLSNYKGFISSSPWITNSGVRTERALK